MNWLTGRDPLRNRRMFDASPEERSSSSFPSWKRMIIKAEQYAEESERSPIKDAYTVDESWLVFANFLKDMGEKPEGMFLNRFDRCKPFTKENCQWATRPELNKHTEKNELIEYSAMRKTKSQWARYLNVPLSTLRNKARKGTLLEYIQQRLASEPEESRV